MSTQIPSPVYMPQEVEEVADVLHGQWTTVVWNDPVNLMSYVTWVFMSYFGYPRGRAHRLMMEVHVKGRSIVARGSKEKMEADVQAMCEFGLWATLEREAE
ncbi:MAG: ATP-dependent Clp protease adapter ClpS [Actinomycetaceae bacterium]|nr:ATP-dependent Clp protease adapter ClpS [Actinomycetaceae bacterium]